MIEASDTGSTEAGREGRGRDFWPADESGRKRPSPKLLLGAAAALAAVVVAVVAVLVFTGGEDAPAAKTALPTAYTPDFNGEGFAEIASRSADARAITEGEAASAKELKAGAHSFKLAESELTGDCKSATWGARLQGDLAKFGCSQIVRSAYVSADKKYVGQFFVINMETVEGVKQILRDLQRETGAGWVTPLNPPGVPAFGAGFSAAYAKTYGHYAVITWVERAGGDKSTTLNELIDVSLVIEGAADFLYGRLDLASGTGAGQ
ncbi:hypothetical protein [Actinomadura sp. 7K507]|uniref:hypothetical protein n=1 Tax=Actinomadura sp. 7K507 TaxID=2530365 RepID=UPI0010450AB2|nr:hypothetical protein [Actinomadura sp. 7K507]TDC82726.1 hypothetical protein E1285_30115 [Actinomadura sp. 7K507]